MGLNDESGPSERRHVCSRPCLVAMAETFVPEDIAFSSDATLREKWRAMEHEE